MNLNIIFLLIGLVLSICSKVIQFAEKSKIGDALVIFAGMFFVLAILHTIPSYKELLLTQDGIKLATKITILSILTVVFFQLTTLITFGYDHKIGLLLFIPCVICLLLLLLAIYK